MSVYHGTFPPIPPNPGPCACLQITALFLAAQRGHSEIVKLLVDNGASPVQPCFIQVGDLHAAAHQRHMQKHRACRWGRRHGIGTRILLGWGRGFAGGRAMASDTWVNAHTVVVTGPCGL